LYQCQQDNRAAAHERGIAPTIPHKSNEKNRLARGASNHLRAPSRQPAGVKHALWQHLIAATRHDAALVIVDS
jgi:hypothetical protein